MNRNVAIVTPWYPTGQLPFRGAFVQAMVEATAPECDAVTVYHCDRWSSQLTAAQTRSVNLAHQLLLEHHPYATGTVAGASLRYIPVPMPLDVTFADLGERHRSALGLALPGGKFDAPVVHAHVGVPSGWAAMNHLRENTRFFVTEHATFLDRMLDEAGSRAMYDEVLSRCNRFFVVGEGMRKLLAKAFPWHAERICVVPNPVSFEHRRARPVTELSRWLFLGGLIPRKGVMWLLEAFAQCRAEDSKLSLTLVGDGELRAQLAKRASELGVSDAVTFAGSVPPTDVPRLLHEHDLLVHPSRQETFGVTVVEALAAGLPVLVTKCGGPEEVLAGIEEAAGELVPVEESEKSLVEGYWRLRSRFPHGVDLAYARQKLAERYSYEAVARTHLRHWFG